jgi:hypothetical protein
MDDPNTDGNVHSAEDAPLENEKRPGNGLASAFGMRANSALAHGARAPPKNLRALEYKRPMLPCSGIVAQGAYRDVRAVMNALSAASDVRWSLTRNG